jgi:hypothetical protein
VVEGRSKAGSGGRGAPLLLAGNDRLCSRAIRPDAYQNEDFLSGFWGLLGAVPGNSCAESMKQRSCGSAAPDVTEDRSFALLVPGYSGALGWLGIPLPLGEPARLSAGPASRLGSGVGLDCGRARDRVSGAW